LIEIPSPSTIQTPVSYITSGVGVADSRISRQINRREAVNGSCSEPIV